MSDLTAPDFAASLRAAAEPRYRDFMAKLLPTVPPARLLGVRVPCIRALAGQFQKSPQTGAFLAQLPHEYYEEDLLHALLLNQLRDFDACLAAVEAFLPFVDNWGACDSLRPRAFAANRGALPPHCARWIGAAHPFTVRFGIEMLMVHALGAHFSPVHLAWVADVPSEDYYVHMMQAWYFATALAEQRKATLPYFTAQKLPPAVHRMAVRKVMESRRFTPAQKETFNAVFSPRSDTF